MTIEITWTITAVIAVSSFLSPIFVALINNRHQVKMRRMELEHIEYIRQLDFRQQSMLKQFDVYYADKKAAFSDFLRAAGAYSRGKRSRCDYESLQSSLQTSLLFCNAKSKASLLAFLEYADKIMGSSYTQHERNEYSKALSSVTNALGEELSLTKPVMDCKKGK